MTKVSITGPKTQLETVITTLYQLEVLDIDEYEGELLEKGDPFEEAEDLSQLLVDVRSLKSKLPEVDYGNGNGFSIERIQGSVDEINEKVDELVSERESLNTQINNLNDDIRFFKKINGCELKYSDLEGTKELEVIVGRTDTEELNNIEKGGFQVFKGSQASVIAYRKNDGLEASIRDFVEEEFTVPELEVEGLPEEVLEELRRERKELKQRRKGIKNDLKEIAKEWYPRLDGADEFLTQKVEKAEAPIKFGTTEKAFIAQGWIPSEKYEKVEEVLADVCEGKIHMQKEEDEEEPPVKHNNSRPVKPFESLTDLVSIPRYNEVDPSFLLLLTFPLFFGLMIGDAGYGITSGLVFLAGWKMFPQAAEIFKALLWTSAATFVFGLIYGEMFGFQIYQSPFYRADWWTEIVYLTVGIGVAHVNLGLLVGAYNEYVNHDFMEAVFAKISWIFLQIAAVAGYLTYTAYGATPAYLVGFGIGIPTLLMMYKGEGVEAIVEIPGLVSNILSYIRLFGVCMAAYTLAGTVNAIAGPMYASGTLMGLAGGTLILIVGHTILTFIKIMEGFLQGIRLHYVEMFGQFYHGGGRKYLPFGAE